MGNICGKGLALKDQEKKKKNKKKILRFKVWLKNFKGKNLKTVKEK